MVMPFGLTNAPATYQRLLNKVLEPLVGKGVLCYIDDILIHSKDKEQHLQTLKQVLELLKKARLYVKLSKSLFLQSRVTFVGHTIGVEGIQADKAEIEIIKNWPRPKNLPEMRSFLGMVNYCRRFIKNFSHRTKKLFGLLKSKGTWEWTNEHTKEFENLKDALCLTPVMKLLDQNLEFL